MINVLLLFWCFVASLYAMPALHSEPLIKYTVYPIPYYLATLLLHHFIIIIHHHQFIITLLNNNTYYTLLPLLACFFSQVPRSQDPG